MRKKRFNLIILMFILASACTGCRSSYIASEDESGSSAAITRQPESTEITTEPETYSDESVSSDFPYVFESRKEDVYTTEQLNIRTAPSTDADVLLLLAPDKRLKRTGYHEEWSRLEYAGQVVYASSEYLTTVSPGLSDEIQYFGYDRVSRSENNVPGLISWYTRNWGNYADFIQDTDSNLIYLTMDEGYENSYTPEILDVLKEKGVKSVFFVTKSFVDSHPELVQRMIDEGHILGNHTCAHPAGGMPSLSPEEQAEDIMMLHSQVLEQFGYEMKLFRFPSGIFSEHSLDIVYSLGYRSVFWSFAYRDFIVDDQPDPADSLAQCISELHPGAIYLLHAVSETNAKILSDWIDAVRASGYEFGIYPVS